MAEVYQMNLKPSPFQAIKNGQKVVEMRLNKNGRDKIKPGDFIVFNNEQNGEKIKVTVTSVSKFSSFEELYKNYDKKDLGYLSDQQADPNDMLIYYKKEDIIRFGVLAIMIKLL